MISYALASTIPTVADLRALTPPAYQYPVRVLGKLEPGDQGGQLWIWDAGSVATDNGITVATPNAGGAGRWIAQNKGVISVKDAGAYGDGVHDDTEVLQAALDAGMEVHFPALEAGAYYKISDELVPLPGSTISGAGWASRIKQTAAHKNILKVGSHTTVKDLHLIGNNTLSLDFDDSNGVYALSAQNVTVERCYIEQSCTGVQVRNCHNITVCNNIIFAVVHKQGSSDISVYSSYGTYGRLLIEGNFCLSNCDMGISVDLLGSEADILIDHNFCITLDPATCIEGGAWAEIADGGNRRHGIILGYQPDVVGGPRCIISNNICRNTLWTGIYKQGSPTAPNPNMGPTIITGNICSLNGYGHSWQGLGGGIYLTQTGHDLIEGNYICDFQGGPGAGGITINGYLGIEPSVIRGNTIRGSLGFGIFCGIVANKLVIEDNTFIYNAGPDIDVEFTEGQPTAGGCKIKHNHILRNDVLQPGIFVNIQDSTLQMVIDDNTIAGPGGGSQSNFNSGITIYHGDNHVEITNNRVSGFYTGIRQVTYWSAGRHFDAQLSSNKLRDCIVGFVCTGDPTSIVPLVDNTFVNITAKTTDGGLGGTACGYVCSKAGDRLVVRAASVVPAHGAWVVGDRVEFDDPTVSGYIGAVVTAMSPMTWKYYGALVS